MTDAEPTTTDVVKTSADNNNNNNSNSNSRRGIALLFLLLISLLSLLRASSTLSKFYTENTSSSSSVVPLVTNYSIAIKAEAARSAAGTTYHQTSETLSIPIYLIDTSNTNHTNIAVSTWGNIAPHWNRTTEYSNLMNLATSVSSLPIDHNNKQQQPKIMVIIHCGPKVGSTTLRLACRKNFERTCPQINLIGKEGRARASPGYFGGIGEDTTRLISVMKECSVDTYYFCVNQISVWDMLPSLTTDEESIANESTTAMMTNQQQQQQQTNNIQYLHLFPFRNYNDWVKSAIKQQYDRGGSNGCNTALHKWENGKCQHSQMEIDLRKYGRVDLDRFLDGVVTRMNSSNSSSGNNNNNDDDKKLKERRGSGEKHTFLLYLHRDLHQVMKVVSTTYRIPMLPGLETKKKGKRPEGTCNESLVELYHECFSDGMMEFRWDLPENQVEK